MDASVGQRERRVGGVIYSNGCCAMKGKPTPLSSKLYCSVNLVQQHNPLPALLFAIASSAATHNGMQGRDMMWDVSVEQLLKITLGFPWKHNE